MTSLLLINPSARSGSLEYGPLITQLEALGPVVAHRLTEEGKTAESIVNGLKNELKRIVIGGGDGTINRLLPLAREIGVPVGILPLGTANDFARSIGLPMEAGEALDVVLKGQIRPIDLGEANGHLYLNAAGIGLGPELTKNLDGERKRRLGVLAYLQSLFEVIGQRKRHRAKIVIDGESYRSRFMQITIANGKHYGGGMTIAPDATLDDGTLRVLCLQPQSPWQLIGKALTLRRGSTQGEKLPQLRTYGGAEVEVITRRTHDVTLDGELVTKTPLTCRCIPGAIEVYTPTNA